MSADAKLKLDRSSKVFLDLKKLGVKHGLTENAAQSFAEAAVKLFTGHFPKKRVPKS